MMGLFITPIWIFFTTTIDRLGQGTGALHSLLNDETTLATKSRVLGCYRSMDAMGAVLHQSPFSSMRRGGEGVCFYLVE